MGFFFSWIQYVQHILGEKSPKVQDKHRREFLSYTCKEENPRREEQWRVKGKVVFDYGGNTV